MILVHQIALELTEAQAHYCRRAAGTARFTYNWDLAEWQRQYKAGQKPTALGLKKQWNARKHAQFPWIAATHKDANQHPFTQLATAFPQFFRREAQYPRFKKKGQHDRFYVSNDKCTVAGKSLRLPVLGWVRKRAALCFTGKILSVTVSRTAHRWYASIAVRVKEPPRACEHQAVVGVDLGITHLATLSHGTVVAGPPPLRKLHHTLRRLHRRLARTVKGAPHRQKVTDRLARLHARIACQRRDALSKRTTTLVRDFGTIVMEDLHVQGMLRNHRLARAISAMGFGTFRRLLTYKAARAGVRLVVADRRFPSSKRCSRCGVLHETLTLNDRIFSCPASGVVIDRDRNTALHLRNLPWASGEVTPVDTAALATVSGHRKTAVGEAGTTEDALLCAF